MLAKCVNPVCSAQFRYLRQGKLFEVEIQYLDTPSDNSQREVGDGRVQIERCWLCDECAAHITLRFDKRLGLVMVHSLV